MRHGDKTFLAREEIIAEFKRLDLFGEGRVTYLALKTALDLFEVEEEDAEVRQWFAECDRGRKGFFDLSDYEAMCNGRDHSHSTRHSSSSSSSSMVAGRRPMATADLDHYTGDRTGTSQGIHGLSRSRLTELQRLVLTEFVCVCVYV